MTLVIDCGNSMLKWATASGLGIGARGEASLLDADGDPFVALARAVDPRTTDALIASVARDEIASRIESALAARGIGARFVEVAAEAFGIVCGYDRPETLGVDRWLSMIACRRAVRGAFVVIGAGTAVTIDAVLADGTHLGGLILAGERLKTEALAANTGRIGLAPPAGSRPAGIGLLGRSTAIAVAHGSRLEHAAAIDRAIDVVAQAIGAAPRVILTGGDAARLEGWLETHAEIRADLVLEGLAVVALGPESP